VNKKYKMIICKELTATLGHYSIKDEVRAQRCGANIDQPYIARSSVIGAGLPLVGRDQVPFQTDAM
jgi:hypothetical protein